jgi:uncharacterized protein (TIGR01777 family)
MKVFLTGGTGFVGRNLTRKLIALGHQVTVITRSAQTSQAALPEASFVEGNPARPGSWQNVVPTHDVIINLAGRSIFTYWTEKARHEIIHSRVSITRNVVDALRAAPPGTLLISTSAVGYYGSTMDDRSLDEDSPPGKDFLAEVGKRWEAEAMRAESFGVRVVRCRFGIILGKNGGAIEKMIPAFRYCLGSPLGSGKQWFSWIHLEDILGILVFLMENKGLCGALNATAPHPVRNKELTETLARVLRRPLVLPALPGFLLRSALGEFGNILLEGQRVVPKKLLDSGYPFRFATLEEALQDLIGGKAQRTSLDI